MVQLNVAPAAGFGRRGVVPTPVVEGSLLGAQRALAEAPRDAVNDLRNACLARLEPSAIAGVPQASDSSTTSPNPSSATLGTTETSAAR